MPGSPSRRASRGLDEGRRRRRPRPVRVLPSQTLSLTRLSPDFIQIVVRQPAGGTLRPATIGGMPRRPPDRHPRRETAPGRSHAHKSRRVGGANGRATGWTGFGEDSFVEDPTGTGTAQIRRIQPYQADKTYICPGCNQEIRPGTGHLVIVPVSDPAGRRHWHSPCWEHRARRRPTGR